MSHSAGIFASLRGFATTGVALVRTRFALFALEARAEGERLVGLLLWGAATVLLGLLGLTFLAVFFTVLLWDTQRLLMLSIFTTVFLALAAIAAAIALRLARQGSQLFAASLAELRHDEDALRDPHRQ